LTVISLASAARADFVGDTECALVGGPAMPGCSNTGFVQVVVNQGAQVESDLGTAVDTATSAIAGAAGDFETSVVGAAFYAVGAVQSDVGSGNAHQLATDVGTAESQVQTAGVTFGGNTVADASGPTVPTLQMQTETAAGAIRDSGLGTGNFETGSGFGLLDATGVSTAGVSQGAAVLFVETLGTGASSGVMSSADLATQGTSVAQQVGSPLVLATGNNVQTVVGAADQAREHQLTFVTVTELTAGNDASAAVSNAGTTVQGATSSASSNVLSTENQAFTTVSNAPSTVPNTISTTEGTAFFTASTGVASAGSQVGTASGTVASDEGSATTTVVNTIAGVP
jgi:hypothetical protein